jgi:hypothetical protein
LPEQRNKNPLPDAEDIFIDLFAAETALLLSYTMYLMRSEFAKFSSRLCARIERELRRRIMLPFMKRNDFEWMGFYNRVNNWNPWILSNIMRVFALVEKDEPAREKGIVKACKCLDNYMKNLPADGSCDEGVLYWNVAGGAVFDCLESLYLLTGGAADFFKFDIVKRMGRFVVYAHIADKYFINFADCSAVPPLDYHMIYRFGKRIGDADMVGMALANADRQNGRSLSVRRNLPAILDGGFNAAKNGRAPLLRDVWLPDSQIMTARLKSGGKEGLFLGAKGGSNDEYHNHNDVGSFIVYADGKPVIIDVGVGEYTKKTFTHERYDIWTMQSQFHNLPTVNGVMQRNGELYRATDASYRASDGGARLSLKIDGAYPAESGLVSLFREFTFDRTRGEITVKDGYEFKGDNNGVSYNFMSCVEPATVPGGAEYPLDGGAANLTLELAPELSVRAVEHHKTDDSRLYAAWGDGGVFRLVADCRVGTRAEIVFCIRLSK